MTDNNKNISRLEDLFFELKKYVELKEDYYKLDLTEKLTKFFSRAILILTLTVFGLVILFNASFMLVLWLESYLQNIVLSFALVGGIWLVVSICIYLNRTRLITQPIVNYFGKLLLDKKDQNQKKP